MFNTLFDFAGPVAPGGIEPPLFDGMPIPIDGPTTLQLALVGIGTLAVYALLRRPKRERSAMAGARRLPAADRTAVAHDKSSRDAA
jgi:hypothetical protein